MSFSELKKVNEEMFDNNSELLANVAFGTPWVELIMLYIKNTKYRGSASKLLVDIASNYEEISRNNTVIYNDGFKANRLPTLHEVEVAMSLLKSNNDISNMIKSRLKAECVECVNELSRESHKMIIELIDFEVSSVPMIYYLLGYQYLDNRDKDCIYGVNKMDIVKITEEGSRIISNAELCGVKTNSFNLSSLF